LIDSGSTVSTVNALRVGDGNGSHGTVTMNGGNVTSGFAIIGNAGALASFNQVGGTYMVNGSLTVDAAVRCANGTFNLSCGALMDNTAFIGTFSTGAFNQTGGGHTTLANLTLGFQGGLGTYTLRGGDYTVVGDITTGFGTGTLN